MTQNLIARTPSAYGYPLLIKQLFEAPLVDNPDQEIVYKGSLRFTYRDFRERVQRLAGALVAQGVKPGDTVAILDWDSHRYLECFFAVPMIGAVLHTVNVRLTPEQILFTINHAEDDVILVHKDFLPILEAIKGRIDTVRRFVLLTDDDAPAAGSISFAGEYEGLLVAAPARFDFPDFDENTRATTFYTTGTTGVPKGVYFSHRQLVLHTLVALAALGTPRSQGRFHREDVYMPLTPMFHVHAWGVPYLATTMGIKQVYPGRYVPDLLLELIRTEKVTFTHCVPMILRMLLRNPGADRYDLSGLTMLIGGAALPKALCLEAMRRGMDILAGYGMSETCPILTIAHLKPEMLALDEERQAEMRCRTGLPVPLVHARLIDENGGEVPADGASAGEIVVRSPWLSQGYLKDTTNSEKLWQGGWLHTNDIAVRDEEGYFRITDRLKDVVKVGGEWVSSLELEDLIAQHPAVAEVAVIGAPDDRWGERPLALVVLKPGDVEGGAEKAIVHFVKDYVDKGFVSKHALLLKVKTVETIDKTSVGKTNKVALRQKHL
ncbi:MAG: fatty acid--CoA ligase [Candidatus Methylomirabilia bacterium]